MDLTAVRNAIATSLTGISGLQTYAVVPDSVNVPCAIVGMPTSVDFDQAMGRGLDRMTIPVRLMVSRADGPDAQADLDGYVAGSGAKSVKTAVEVDKTLGGTVDTVRVTQATGFGAFEVGDVSYLGCDFSVEVYG